MSYRRVLISVATMLLVCTFAKGQTHVEIGTGISDIRGNYPQTGCHQSAVAGVGYGVRISERWMVDPMVQITLEGKEKHGIGYCKIPVALLYCSGNFKFGAGPYMSCRVWEETNEDWSCIYLPTYPEQLDIDAIYDYQEWHYKRFDAGIMGKVSYMIKKVYLGLEGSYGIRDIGRRYDSYVINGHTLSANFVVGYMF